MNRLAYVETNDPRWSISMPTFSIDGWDLADLLGVTSRLYLNQVASVGAV
jgi:hypothetical protein